MASRLTKTTTDHDEIRRWAEERGGQPAEVERTEREGQTGIIRIDFPGYSGEGSLKPISWDEWFQKFDESNLALVYQETTSRGQKSNFNKLVGRETAEARAQGENKASRRSLRGRGRGRSAARDGASASAGRGRRKAAGTRGTSRTRRGASQRSTRGGASKRSTGRSSSTAREAPRTWFQLTNPRICLAPESVTFCQPPRGTPS
jgi:hypothetical protein